MGSRPTEHVETELKFEVGVDFVLPDLSAVADGAAVSAPEVYHLVASYFDTADLRLAKARITLRRRTGGSDAGWHLKLPVTAGTRRELQLPLADGDDGAAVPAQLRSQVAACIRDEPLQVVAVLETRRTVLRLTGLGGETLAEVADDAVTGRVPAAGDAPGGPATWREIEVELVSGGPELLAAAGARLRTAGARPSSSASKLGRLLGARAAR
jgi:inorganic triphosphatase YgiF